MNLFNIQSTVDGVNKVKSYLEDNYIGIPWSVLGDLEQVSMESIVEQLERRYNLAGGELNDAVETVHTFVNLIEDGDYVVMKDEEWMYIGDVGDYYYDDSIGTSDDLICHRRGVTWLGRVPLEEINEHMQILLSEPKFIAQLMLPVTQAQLDQALRGTEGAAGTVLTEMTELSAINTVTGNISARVEQSTINTALEILERALQSENEQIRVHAAAAILQYAKS
ncbi:hypothetical protein [Paenibacillus silvae]|uniref:hypothetical protein n=1 Tax=Paenibacillus silvae TaxID=1325358 RepID=UPI002003AC5E|nr:hypothetical protein [Paenibacillus silvae]MCK6073517.1 hypothetical protein [Paenibacillus silvae]MCK6149007.1 hypothetical protein [Paenibacillus silvae]MCK6267306.1 hypothetical protein [Paenibacillus silvae]